MFADSRYADIEKKCRYADIADADINIGTPLIYIPSQSIEIMLFLLSLVQLICRCVCNTFTKRTPSLYTAGESLLHTLVM